MAESSDAAPEGRRPRVAVVALGCRVNRADMDALAGELAPGFDLARPGERADVVVVNTCSVTADADSAARQALRRAAREHPGVPIVAAGCYAELHPEHVSGLPGVAAVVGARSNAAVAGVVVRVGRGERGGAAVRAAVAAAADWGLAPGAPAHHTRPFLKVQDGCDQRCSYCVVPAARGPSRSLPLDEALRRIASLGERHPEVVLTGVHLGRYGHDLSRPTTLGALVAAAVRAGAVHRLRLSSVEPDELPRELLASPEARAALCDHFHLPIQSGSERILAAMRRPHGAGALRRAAEDVWAALPGACIGTDVMVGFPGETDADHRATRTLVEELPIAYLHVFPFSARPGTAAAALPAQVPPGVARERARELRALSDRRWRSFLAAQAGRELEVVVERVGDGIARGTARGWLTVRWPAAGERRGGIARVRVTGNDGAACEGVGAVAGGSGTSP